MKNPLNKSLKKEFTDNLARYLALALVMIVMIATVSGFFSVAYSVNNLFCGYGDHQYCAAEKIKKSGRLLPWAKESSLACGNVDRCGYLDRGGFYPGQIGSGL